MMDVIQDDQYSIVIIKYLYLVNLIIKKIKKFSEFIMSNNFLIMKNNFLIIFANISIYIYI